MTVGLHPDSKMIKVFRSNMADGSASLLRDGELDSSHGFDFRSGMIIVSTTRRSNDEPTKVIPGLLGFDGPEVGLPSIKAFRKRIKRSKIKIDPQRLNNLIVRSILSRVRYRGSCISNYPFTSRPNYDRGEVTVQYGGICQFFNTCPYTIHFGDRLRLTLPSMTSSYVANIHGNQKVDQDNTNLSCNVFFGLEKVDSKIMGQDFVEIVKANCELYLQDATEFLALHDQTRDASINTISFVYHLFNVTGLNTVLGSYSIGTGSHMTFGVQSRYLGNMPTMSDPWRDFAPKNVKGFGESSVLKKRENGDHNAYLNVLMYLLRLTDKVPGANTEDKTALDEVHTWVFRLDPHDRAKNDKIRRFFYRRLDRKALAQPGDLFSAVVFVSDPMSQSSVLGGLLHTHAASKDPKRDTSSFMGGLTGQALQRMRTTNNRITDSKDYSPNKAEESDCQLLKTVGNFLTDHHKTVLYGLAPIDKRNEIGITVKDGSNVESVARSQADGGLEPCTTTDAGKLLTRQMVEFDRFLQLTVCEIEQLESEVVGISTGTSTPGGSGAYLSRITGN